MTVSCDKNYKLLNMTGYIPEKAAAYQAGRHGKKNTKLL